jgi:uncharacterized protein
MLGQTWRDLLFAHWPVRPDALRAVVPPSIPLDTWEGDAWIGVTPFVVTGWRPRGLPPAPRLSVFPELNVRTYVEHDGRPGIYFLSLDAASSLAVAGARRSHRLPYFKAAMTVGDGGRISYVSRRTSRDGPPAAFRASYWSLDAARYPSPGTLEHWLTERYCHYTVDERLRVLRGDIHHGPWAVQTAAADIALNTMVSPFGIALAGEPLLHFCGRQDTLLWGLAPA